MCSFPWSLGFVNPINTQKKWFSSLSGLYGQGDLKVSKSIPVKNRYQSIILVGCFLGFPYWIIIIPNMYIYIYTYFNNMIIINPNNQDNYWRLSHYIDIYIYIYTNMLIHIIIYNIISGWWLGLPLWKIWVRQLGLWTSQYMEKYNSCSKPPTSNMSIPTNTLW